MAKTGQVDRLENVVYFGQGALVLSLSKSWNEDVRGLIKNIPQIQVASQHYKNGPILKKQS